MTRITQSNLDGMRIIRHQIEKVNKEKSQQLEIRIYDMIPRFNIYVVNDRLMTVQGYAYGRGEETPVLVLERKTTDGLFDFYVSIVKHILEQSKESNEKMQKEKEGL